MHPGGTTVLGGGAECRPRLRPSRGRRAGPPGLRLLETIPPTPESVALELPLQTTLGLQFQVTQGYADPGAERAYSRARNLCPRDSDSASLFPVLWGLWLIRKVRSELAEAQGLADELDALARRLNDPAFVLQAHQAQGMTALCRGEPAAAARHVEQTAALYNPVRHRGHASLFGQDPAVICKAFGAVALWLLGFPESAERQSEAAIRMSRELSPSSQAVALHFASMLHQLRRDVSRTLACAEASAAIAAEHGFSFWRAGAAVMSGWALTVSGRPEEGIGRLRQGLLDWQATGSRTYQTYYLGLLAEVCGEQGRSAEGLCVLEEALAQARQTGEGLYEAELYRLHGELTLRAGVGSAVTLRGAEEACHRALDIARRQEAISLELRAAMSLTRLGQRLGALAGSQRLLAEVLGRLTEGFQTPDVRVARQLLEGSGIQAASS